VALGSIAGALASAGLGLPTNAAFAQENVYKLHLENGVKLFADKNYPAALAEFQAAYEAKPSPNPLVNIALCEKALFRYPKAIVALETALERYAAVMDPGDKTAATEAIAEMRALLGNVTLSVVPATATVLVDGETLKEGAITKPIPLGPGDHKVEVRADGFVAAERTVTVVSGEQIRLTLALARDSVALVAPRTTAPVVEPAPTAPKRDQASERRGPYALALGSVLMPLTHSIYLRQPDNTFGPAYGLRIGFQVNRMAGFDVSYEHSNLFTNAGTSSSVSYSVMSNRLSGALRLIYGGPVVRVLGTIGGGVVIDSLSYTGAPTGNGSGSVCVLQEGVCPLAGSSAKGSPGGVDAFALGEAGIELDLDHVLVDIVAESQFEATGNFTSTATSASVPGVTSPVGIFGASPIINVGPALRIGYRFW
jgi:hypothetical protein